MRYLILLPLLCTGIYFSHATDTVGHPYYVSVTEIEYNQPDQEIQIAVKIFTDDFEQALRGMYHSKVDLFHPGDKAGLEKKIAGYIQQHLQVSADQKLMPLRFLGHEIEGEATWCYFSAAQKKPLKRIDVFNNLLYEYKKEQVNIVHVRVHGVRKSTRLTFPETQMQLTF